MKKQDPDKQVMLALNRTLKLARKLEISSKELRSLLFETDAPHIAFCITEDMLGVVSSVIGLGMTTEKILNSYTYSMLEDLRSQN